METGLHKKVCSKCGKKLTIDNFSSSKRGLFGIRADCKSCVKIRKSKLIINRLPDGSMKYCNGCKQHKIVSEFLKTNTNISGYRSRCTICKNSEYLTYRRTHRKQNHRQYRKLKSSFKKKEAVRGVRRRNKVNLVVAKIKESKPCKDCDRRYPYYCMDFDHVDPSQKIKNIKELKSSPSFAHIKSEIDKCDLVCVNCHRIRTVARCEATGKNFYSTQKLHRDFVTSHKLKPCVDCNGSFHPAAMDFDHVRGEKIGAMSQLVRRLGKSKLLDEIAKCDLVCSCCHRKRTHTRNKRKFDRIRDEKCQFNQR